jgi:eukaryotic-like serine/threonine-protein kinase
VNSLRSNVTAKMPIIARAGENPGSGERASIRLSGAPFAPRVVGRYLLCDVFAAGGMATVHLGRLMGPEGFSRTVAIKQLHPQFAHDPKFVAMFLDEARLASRVHHPNVVSPLDVISDPPDLFMVMDYVHGEPLSRLLRRRAPEPIPPRIAAAIVGQALLGLHAAHEATGERGEPLELVHRDVSPHNILVAKDGVARVVDFGIAKAKARSQQTERGMLKGKLGYMAPEQINMETVDRRADVFAVGVVLWELLTGQRLFDGDTPHVVLQKLMERPIPAPSSLVPELPADLDHVVLAALSRSTEERFDNARAMAQALDYSIAPASMLELSAWVEARAGADLAARAELVLDVEALSFDDFTRAARNPLAAPLAPAPLIDASAQEGVEPSALSVAEPAPAKSRFRKGWLLPALACVCGALFLLWTRSHQQTAAPARSAGPTLVAIPAPARTAELTVHTGVAAPVAEPPKLTESSPAIAAVAPAPPRVASAKAVASTSVPALHGKAAAPGPCDVPYVIDKHGVKRFKEACF